MALSNTDKDNALIALFNAITEQNPWIWSDMPPALLPATNSAGQQEDPQAVRQWMMNNPLIPEDKLSQRVLDKITNLSLPDFNYPFMPPEIALLKTLQILEINGSADLLGPIEWSDDLDLPALRVFKSENFLTHLPKSLNSHKTLKCLTIRGGSFVEFSDEFCPENLEELHIHYASITQLPSSLNSHKKLCKLYIIGCPIKEFPLRFNPQNLHTLFLRESSFEQLPPALSAHKNLENLGLYSLPMKNLAPRFNPENLKKLEIVDTPISSLPPAITLPNLETIRLSGTGIKQFPLEFEPENLDWEEVKKLRDYQLFARTRGRYELVPPNLRQFYEQ